MSITIRFLGTAAFEIITADEKRVFIDPFLEENQKSPYKLANLDHLDLLLVTHAAYDHLGDTLQIMRQFPDLKLICGADVRGYLMHHGIDGMRLRAIPWGMMIEEEGVKVRPIYSRHWSYIQADDGAVFSSTPMGFIIHVGDGHRVYHSGDTALYSDMKLYGELYRPTIGLINVGVPGDHRGAEHGVPQYLTGEMDAVEAAMATKWLGLQYAIPCHHDDAELPEIVKFKELLSEEQTADPDAAAPVILEPGESLVLA